MNVNEEKEITEEEIPLADIPETAEEIAEEDLFDEEVPLARVPETRDSLWFWVILAAACIVAIKEIKRKK